jgi:CDP-diacylglycerol pyrophosphatase
MHHVRSSAIFWDAWAVRFFMKSNLARSQGHAKSVTTTSNRYYY